MAGTGRVSKHIPPHSAPEEPDDCAKEPECKDDIEDWGEIVLLLALMLSSEVNGLAAAAVAADSTTFLQAFLFDNLPDDS
jgi:hypothetical protein